jgi:Putative peptidoglycan binding domain
VPRQIAEDDNTPRRRRRGTGAVAIEPEAERGFAMRILLHSPKDMVAGLLAFAAVSAIVANALFLQAGHHPAPMFGSAVAVPAAVVPASPLPRPRPTEAALLKPADAVPAEAKPVESRSVESRSVESRSVESKPVESKPVELKAADPMANLVKATNTPPPASSAIVRPPAPIPVAATVAITGSRRVAAVQRTLTEYGYGQLKPTGTISADTQAAIQKFERERKIPVTGQMSDRLVHELSAMVGKPIE